MEVLLCDGSVMKVGWMTDAGLEPASRAMGHVLPG
jgi:hypothetical protein